MSVFRGSRGMRWVLNFVFGIFGGKSKGDKLGKWKHHHHGTKIMTPPYKVIMYCYWHTFTQKVGELKSCINWMHTWPESFLRFIYSYISSYNYHQEWPYFSNELAWFCMKWNFVCKKIISFGALQWKNDTNILSWTQLTHFSFTE